jgi:hypothetical protein
VLLSLQALFGLPAGTCARDTVSWVVWIVDAASVALAIVAVALARDTRRFALGVALLLCPATFFWSMVTAMTIEGCWI